MPDRPIFTSYHAWPGLVVPPTEPEWRRDYIDRDAPREAITPRPSFGVVLWGEDVARPTGCPGPDRVEAMEVTRSHLVAETTHVRHHGLDIGRRVVRQGDRGRDLGAVEGTIIDKAWRGNGAEQYRRVDVPRPPWDDEPVMPAWSCAEVDAARRHGAAQYLLAVKACADAVLERQRVEFDAGAERAREAMRQRDLVAREQWGAATGYFTGSDIEGIIGRKPPCAHRVWDYVHDAEAGTLVPLCMDCEEPIGEALHNPGNPEAARAKDPA